MTYPVALVLNIAYYTSKTSVHLKHASTKTCEIKKVNIIDLNKSSYGIVKERVSYSKLKETYIVMFTAPKVLSL